jgi:hypothetical protein
MERITLITKCESFHYKVNGGELSKARKIISEDGIQI